MEPTVQETRRNTIKEATGLSVMAGSCPPDILFQLLEDYIAETKTMQEVRETFNERFFVNHAVK